MKKNMMFKDFLREVKKTKSRFLSILLIAGLGVAFLSGIRAASPDMKLSADVYYDDSRLMDVRVMGTLGLTEDDVREVAGIQGVKEAEAAYSADVLCDRGDDQQVLKLMSLTENMNLVTVKEGRLPQKSGEIFMDSGFMAKQGYELGDVLTLESGTEDEISDTLAKSEYVVVGAGSSPFYLSVDRGTSTVGNGTVGGFGFILPQDFSMEVYTELFLRVEGVEEEICYSDGYTDQVDVIQERIEAIAGARCEIRYADVQQEGQEQIAEGEQEIQDARQQLQDARTELDEGWTELRDGQAELEEGIRELEDGRRKLEDGKTQLRDGEAQISSSKQELSAAKTELEENSGRLNEGRQALEEAKGLLSQKRQELESGKAQLEQYKGELGQQEAAISQKRQELESGKAQLEAYEAQLSQKSQELEQSREQVEELREMLPALEAAVGELEQGISQLEGGKAQLEQGIGQLEQGISQLEGAAASLEAEISQLEQDIGSLGAAITSLETELGRLEAEAGYLESGISQLRAEISRLEESLGQLPPESGEASQLQQQLDTKRQELAEKEQEFAGKRQELSGKRQQLDTKRQELAEKERRLPEARQELAAGEAQLEQLSGELESRRQQLAQLQQQLTPLLAQQQELSGKLAQAQQAVEEFEAGEAQLEEAKTALSEQRKQLEEGEGQLAAGEAQIAEAKKQLSTQERALEEGEGQLAAGEAQLKEQEQTLVSGESQIAAARQQISQGEAQLADGERQLEESRRTIAQSETELAEGEAELAEGRQELLDAETELAKGEEEYREKAEEAQDEIAEGEEQLAEARRELAELEEPEWYVLGRDESIQTYIEYEQDAERIDAIGQVFPAIFFLVAALVCLTTMTRMVEENRTQVGTLKALGYRRGAIAGKYIGYAFFASLTGGALGLVLGQKLLPVIIIEAYGILYNNLPVVKNPIYAGLSLYSTGIAVAVTTAAALFACYHELREVPAQLMRPEAPKNGKRVFLERIGFLWKRLNFTQKSTVRNLIRYKKRFFMTVLGIGGCMGLLLVGFGLKDSIMAIGERQFSAIRTFSSTLTLEDGLEERQKEALMEQVLADSQVEKAMWAYEKTVDMGVGRTEKSGYLVVVKDVEQLSDYVTLRDRRTGEQYSLEEEGVILTEKMAKLLEVSEGDAIWIQDGDGSRREVVISHITENYFYHYVYMTEGLYEQLYGAAPDYGEIFTINESEGEAFEEGFQSRYMKLEGIQGVAFNSTVEDRISDMLKSMDTVIYVLVVSAGLLAFIVLYNLNNINISERKRELATLKVLGFYDREVSSYVTRENICLTLIGCAAGVIIGQILHRFVIVTAEIDLMMFGRSIKGVSYLYSVLLTFLFSVLVNVFMHFRLKKVDMVESMKSVE